MLAVAVRLWLRQQVPDFAYEDAFITYRYAQNLASGHGFVYNLGEHVFGTTTPLYTLLLAAFDLGGLSHVTMGPVLNLLADAGAVVLVGIILRRWGLAYSILGMVLSALLFASATASISGMETGIYSFLSLLVLFLYLRGNHYGWAVASAAVILVRPDGVSVLLVVTLFCTLLHRRLPIRQLGLCALILLPWILFSTWYFGSPLPNSISAKSVLYSSQSGLFDNNGTVDRLINLYLPPSILTFGTVRLLLAALGVVACLAFARPVLPLFLWFGVYYGGLVLSRTHLHPWYLVPPLHVYTILTVLGVVCIARFMGAVPTGAQRERQLRLSTLACAALAPIVLVIGITRLQPEAGAMAEFQRYNDEVLKAAGSWLEQNAEPSARVYLESTGYAGYFSQRFVLDAAGLVSPQFVPLNAREFYDHCLKVSASRPDYVVVREYLVPGIESCESDDGFWRKEYIFVKSFAMSSKPDQDGYPTYVLYKRQVK